MSKEAHISSGVHLVQESHCKEEPQQTKPFRLVQYNKAARRL